MEGEQIELLNRSAADGLWVRGVLDMDRWSTTLNVEVARIYKTTLLF